MKITDIDKEIKKRIVTDRQKEYGDYQHNFTILAELFTLILAPNLKKKLKPHQVGQIMMTLKLFRTTKGYKADNYHDLSIYNDMTFDLHKKDIDKNDKIR
jgi:hypothetical protein